MSGQLTTIANELLVICGVLGAIFVALVFIAAKQ